MVENINFLLKLTEKYFLKYKYFEAVRMYILVTVSLRPIHFFPDQMRLFLLSKAAITEYFP